jgi:tetratricopeptide (TPR) repeat protein
MKKVSLFVVFPVILTGTCLLAFNSHNSTGEKTIKKSYPVTCGSFAANNIDTAADGKYMIKLPGWGNYNYSISTHNDSAQFYFNQGLTMYYSYHMKEALASFKEAARFDRASPMTYWGQALTMGPYYNAVHLYKVPQGLPGVLQRLNTTAGNASEKEKALISVMNLRYPLIKDQTNHDEKAYAQGMRKLVSAYPDDADIKMLYIDAMMLIHPWDFWTTDGLAKQWTPELVDLCKGVLKAKPDNPAALHYYIHLTEASHNPEVAIANAEALKRLFPAVGHMVHMASHVYQRNGLYFQGVDANEKSGKSSILYASMVKNLSLAKSIPHVYAVETYCAFSGGMYEKAREVALRCRNSVKPTTTDSYAQYLYMMPVLTMIRLGKWEEILKDNNPPAADWTYAQVLHDFAKGLAFIYTGRPDSANSQLGLIRDKINAPVLKIRDIPFNTPFEGATIAENILEGAILLAQNKYESGIASFNKAVTVEDHMIYSEPAQWPIPARQFLGAYLLKNDDNIRAEQVYRADLVRNPGNGWSLLGLYQSIKAQNRKQNLAEYKSGFLRSFSHADVVPTGSVFME